MAALIARVRNNLLAYGARSQKTPLCSASPVEIEMSVETGERERIREREPAGTRGKGEGGSTCTHARAYADY